MSRIGMTLSKEEIFLHSSQIIIIGDIEGQERLYKSTKRIIKDNQGHLIIFLGDLISNSQNSINSAVKIIKLLNVPDELNIRDNFYNDDAIKEIINILHNKLIYKGKNIYKRSRFSRNLHVLPSQNTIINISKQNYLFLLGNKEKSFIIDLYRSNIRRNNDKIIFEFNQNGIHTYEFNLENFSYIMNYLYLCQHFIIIDDILFIHNFINKKYLIEKGELKIKTIVSGHNKCYGHFKWNFWQMKYHVYMVDLTSFNGHIIDNEDLKNCMIIYQNNNNETIFDCSYNPRRFIQPYKTFYMA